MTYRRSLQKINIESLKARAILIPFSADLSESRKYTGQAKDR